MATVGILKPTYGCSDEVSALGLSGGERYILVIPQWACGKPDPRFADRARGSIIDWPSHTAQDEPIFRVTNSYPDPSGGGGGVVLVIASPTRLYTSRLP